ncbi:MAG: hypothetical protein JXM73_22850 [Anaerolineae bacterium]|nr:hypothetical protein [Anaerolineae bacterium]
MDRETIVDWLSGPDNPPVRLLTLTRLLQRPDTDAEVQETRDRLMDYSVTQGILAHGEQFWPDDNRAYAKYTGKYWQVIFLGQFLADGQDPRIAPGVLGLLADRKWVNRWRGGQCLTANMLAAFMRLGYGAHPVVVEETEALAERILVDQGIQCEAMSYSLLSRCYMALPKLLLCFGQVPPEARSPAVSGAIDWIAQTLVSRQVYHYVPGNRKAWQEEVLAQAPKRADLPPGETVKGWIADRKRRFLAERGLGELEPKRGWTQFGFPLSYNSDILEAMFALAAAGAPMSQALEDPLQLIRDRRTAGGVWLLENSLNGKMWVDVEVRGQPSKWLTLFALIVLDHFGSQ